MVVAAAEMMVVEVGVAFGWIKQVQRKYGIDINMFNWIVSSKVKYTLVFYISLLW